MKFAYDLNFWRDYCAKVSISHDFNTHCHLLLTGASGSGKSYALLFLLKMLIESASKCTLYFCDFKNSEEFAFLKKCENYYAGSNCYTGILNYHKQFTKIREQGLQSKNPHLLVCDEYPALLNYLQNQDRNDKGKRTSEITSAVSDILMQGRGLHFGVWIITQRADSSFFANGARDNFMVIIGLGRMSREQRGMIFSGEEIPEQIFQTGEGLILADGCELRGIKFPRIMDIESWNKEILQGLVIGSAKTSDDP